MPNIIPPSDTTYISSLLSAPPQAHTPAIASTITTLNLQDHIEGGHFVETDRDPRLVPNPFASLPRPSNATTTAQERPSETRNASTTIYYLVTPRSPVGHFHRNSARTVHTLHWGRGRYVVLHVDQAAASGEKVAVETFVVGKDIEQGEKLQWIVEGGKFKASFLLPDDDHVGAEGVRSEKGLLISETVVPGFEYSDHDFMTAEDFVQSLDAKAREELKWLLKREEQGRLDGVVKEKGSR